MVAAVGTRWHEMIPRNPEENLCWRLAVTKRMNWDKAFAESIRQMCREDILFWINGFVWTYDPRRKPRTKIPMLTYEYQERAILDLVKAVRDGHDLLIEKSRDMGASWICLLVFLWYWMFRDLTSFLLVSRVESYVDDVGNPKSLFWKLDFALKNMPSSIRPRIDRTKLHLLNLDNGSVIDGESTTGRVARGDRRTAILLDEFAAVDQGHKVLSATRDATDCRIFNSTHEGTSTGYYHISRTEIAKIRMHWSQHPRKAAGLYTKRIGVYVPLDLEYWSTRKDWHSQMERFDAKILARGVTLEDGKVRSPWYAEQCERAAHAVEISQELDIDCLGSSYQFFASATIEDYISQHCLAPLRTGEIEFDQDTLEPIRWRDDPKGSIRLWMHLDEKGFPVSPSVVLGFDVSAGTGASNSAGSGIDTVRMEKVFELANPHIRPEAFGRDAVVIARWLSDAKMVWEQNGPGRQFGDAVIEAGYRNVYMRVDEEKVSKVMSDVPGWAPTRDNKLAILGEYRRALELASLINRSESSLRDALEYVYLPNGTVEHSQASKSVDPTGARSNHGDRTMADALAWRLVKSRPTPTLRSQQTTPVGSFAWRRAHTAHKTVRRTAWS